MSNWLIYNCGAQEPRVKVDGRYRLATEHYRPLQRMLGGPFSGMYDAAEAIEKKLGNPEVEPRFPILEPALEYVQKVAGPTLQAVILVATEAGDRKSFEKYDDDPRHNDSHPAARLMQRWLQTEKKIANVTICVIKDSSPHLYGNAKRRIQQMEALRKIPLEDRVFVCTSPGLPMVNSALVQFILDQHQGETHLFQVLEPEREKVERGQWGYDKNRTEGVPEADIASDFLRHTLVKLVDHFNYDTALQVLRRLPETPGWMGKKEAGALIEAASNQWKLTNASTDWKLKYLDQGLFGLQKAEAYGSLPDVNEQVCWLADMADYLEELAGALASGNKKFMERPKTWSEKELKDALINTPYEPLVCRKSGGRLQKVYDKIKEHRNGYVHAFAPVTIDAATVESVAREFRSIFDDMIKTAQVYSWTPPESFLEQNKKIKAALESRDENPQL